MSSWVILVTAMVAAAVTALAMRLHARSLRVKAAGLADCDFEYRTVLDSTSDGIITINADGKVVAVNTAVSAAFGEQAPAFYMLGIDELITAIADQDLSHFASFAALLGDQATEAFGPIEVQARGLDGREFPAEVKVAPASCGGKSNRLVFVRVMTQQVRAEQALKDSEAKFRDLFEQMIDGVYRCLGDGTILAANPAMVKILGYSSENELCRFENALDMCSIPEQRERLLETLQRDGEARDISIDVTAKNGAQRTVLLNVKRVSNTPGAEAVYQGTLSDLSKLQAATNALRDSEEHFRALAENALDMVTVITENGTVRYCSPSCFETTGYAPSDAIGQTVFASIHRDDHEDVQAAIARGIADPTSRIAFTCRFLDSTGEILELESVGSAFRDSSGERLALLNTRDVTERLRTEKHMQRAQKLQAVGQLTGGIAHDFNNLLTVIVSNLQMLEEAALETEAELQVETALAAALQGADLTRSLLAFARRQSLEPRVVKVDELLDGMEPLLRRSLGQPMTTRIECEQDLWPAKVDPTQLESAVLNLAINSRDAMDGTGELTIRCSNSRLNSDAMPDGSLSETGEFVRIAVEDTGTGMTEDVRKAAIEPFFSTKEDGAGSGLGLSMVYGFVRQSGGHMQLQSEHEQGTRIELYLPRSTESVDRQAQAADSEEAPGGQETILVVDDNAQVRNSAVATITRLGYDVLSAANGPEALHVLDSSDVALLFTDLRMPEMTGTELAARAQAAHPQLQVLLTSGFADRPADDAYDDEQFHEFIPKPYKKHDLAIKIRALLDDANYE